MRVQVEKCPNDLALIVPQPFATEAGLREGAAADLELTGGRLVIRAEGPATLAELLTGITPENCHDEWADGPPIGSELL